MTMQERRAAAAATGHHAPLDRRLAPDYVPPPPPPVSWDDFLVWLDEDVRAEWVDGAIIEMSPASAEHQRVAGFLHALLWVFVVQEMLGEVFQPPFLMRLAIRPSGREPDLLFINNEHLGRVQANYLSGPADLVVEILSPESVARDQQDKLAEYEAAGIPEYWLIDPLRRSQWFYQLDADGKYRLIPVGEDGIYTSREVPGFRLRVSWLWQRPFLTPAQAFADLPPAPTA